MKVEFLIPPNSTTFTTNILDREGEICDNVLQLTQALGETVSDERTGPDCDEVHETTTG